MIGGTIGTYRLAELLGDGGLGPVYRGVDQASGREAAFRVFNPDVSRDPMLAERLRAMSGVLKKLQHPNIGAVYEVLTVGADLGMFLEFVPGASLDQVRAQAGRLETNVAVSCAVQVLRALEFAHGAGVLHHALRPSNIRVTPQGTVKVMDFGIGHALGANRKTREDRLLTVIAYLAPEQIQNQPGDARADIYSIGVVLYQLLTGRLPFDHQTEFAMRQAHLQEPVAAPRAYVPGLPEWLDQAVMRALAKNPGARFQNATECRAVLEAALGLSTSKAAAVVRDGGGTTVAMFEAAPPIPPAQPPGSDTDATRVSGAVPPVPPPAPAPAHVPAPAPTPPPSAEATVVLREVEPPPLEAVLPGPPAAEAVYVGAAARASETIVAAPSTPAGQMTMPVEAPEPGALVGPAAERPAEKHVAKSGQAARPAMAGKGGRSGLLVGIVIVVALLGAAGVGGFLWWQGQQQAPASDQAGAAPDAMLPPAADPAPPVSEAVAPPVSTMPPPPSEAAQATPTSPASSAAGAAVPATTPPPAPRRPQTAANPTPKVSAAPLEPVVIAPPPAERPAAEPAAPAKPAAHLVNLPDVSFRKVKLIAQEGASDDAVDVVLMFLPDRVAVTPTSGGATLRSVRYREISGMTYAREERKRLGLIRTAQHLLTIDTRPSALLLRLDKDNVEAILSALESRTGRSVTR